MYSYIPEEDKTEEIRQIYKSIRSEIISRLNEFKKVLNSGNDERIFTELIFCLLTPQSKAKFCWTAVENIIRKDLLLKGTREQILQEIYGIRFKYKKAEYIIEARELFMNDGKLTIKSKILSFRDSEKARDWLVQNINGMGYKEASHFLRNIGSGESLAILDRHILKNLKLFGVIKDMPKPLSRKKYFEIEEGLKTFAQNLNIPMSHLDFVLWHKETGEIFK